MPLVNYIMKNNVYLIAASSPKNNRKSSEELTIPDCFMAILKTFSQHSKSYSRIIWIETQLGPP